MLFSVYGTCYPAYVMVIQEIVHIYVLVDSLLSEDGMNDLKQIHTVES